VTASSFCVFPYIAAISAAAGDGEADNGNNEK